MCHLMILPVKVVTERRIHRGVESDRAKKTKQISTRTRINGHDRGSDHSQGSTGIKKNGGTIKD